ncbi:MAG: hypothetical protein RJB05_471 [Armatimonadota bacterium]
MQATKMPSRSRADGSSNRWCTGSTNDYVGNMPQELAEGAILSDYRPTCVSTGMETPAARRWPST